jgi:hypothetical protein
MPIPLRLLGLFYCVGTLSNLQRLRSVGHLTKESTPCLDWKEFQYGGIVPTT